MKEYGYYDTEDILYWLIANRGSQVANDMISRLAKNMDAETVHSCRVCIQFGDEDPDLMEEIVNHLNRKFKNEVRRSRKISENRKHYAQICAKRGV